MSRSLAVVLAVLTVAGPAPAQTWPERPVRFIIPFSPGGGPDVVLRLVAEPLAKRLGQSVVVENRPGGSGIVALDAIAKAVPDGHTVGLGDNGSLAINPALFKSLPYSAERDLAPVTLLYATPFFLAVNAALPVRTYAEFAELVRANPGKYNYGSAGSGSPTHLDWEVLKQSTGLAITHVPHKGLQPMLTSVVSGDVAAVFLAMTPLRGPVQQGRLRLLMVGQAQRSPAAPEVPAVGEAGAPAGFSSGAWVAVIAPRGVRADIVTRLNVEIGAALREPETRTRIESHGFTPGGGPADEVARLIVSDSRRYAAAVAFSGAKAE
ncbi:MAG: tripartite tricarboxylate transporter substrate binding protein [Burkholderiales bacterium]|nr:tripartite tricarboxylate transporter substrate binding protein [Burkholderiales bacterium]